ncbi:hypothetical protein [Glutamicibacter nicotianae]|uniref:Uncharacterized protein n=1 Tax=Glutamicibacter nicotianae TaxID=37929 RepID=A0ABQ0RMK6_GLUNI|nr:hypothetical protein [Glutamicibacter nicotianae]GEC12716.1 hypothetical protein ANI01nite_19190 [Glutamicibacter nicotianae]
MMLIRALTDDTDKIYVCRNPHTRRWITLQRGNALADSKHPNDALAVARAQARKLPKPKNMNRIANVVVEAVGRIGESPVGIARLGDGRG